MLNQDNELNIDGYSNARRNKHILSKYDIRSFSDIDSLLNRKQNCVKDDVSISALSENNLEHKLTKEIPKVKKPIEKQKKISKSSSSKSKSSKSSSSKSKSSKSSSSKSKSSKTSLSKTSLSKPKSSKSSSSKTKKSKKTTDKPKSKKTTDKPKNKKTTKKTTDKPKNKKTTKKTKNPKTDSIVKETFNVVNHKLDKDTLEATVRLINNKINSMVDDIESIPQPLHKNYKFFLDRLKTLLKNKKLFIKFVIKVTADDSLVNLLQVENFDNESYNNIDNAIENKLLESFAEDDYNNTSNLTEHFGSSNNQNIFIYFIVGIFLYMMYRNCNKWIFLED